MPGAKENAATPVQEGGVFVYADLGEAQRFHSCCIPKPQMLSGFFTKKKPPSATVKYGYMNCGTALKDSGHVFLDRLRFFRLQSGFAKYHGRKRNHWAVGVRQYLVHHAVARNRGKG